MLFLHPILFFTNTFKNNLFVRSGQIKRINKMNVRKLFMISFFANLTKKSLHYCNDFIIYNITQH